MGCSFIAAAPFAFRGRRSSTVAEGALSICVRRTNHILRFGTLSMKLRVREYSQPRPNRRRAASPFYAALRYAHELHDTRVAGRAVAMLHSYSGTRNRKGCVRA